MRLSDVLSKEPSMKFEQVEGFLRKGLPHGGQQKLDVGVVCRNFYCKNCESELTFSTGEKTKISCVGVTNRSVSIDCVLKCPRCTVTVPIWYLVESKDDISNAIVEVRILKRTEKLPKEVLLSYGKYGSYTELLDKADRAFRDGLGAGAVVYLREIMEGITYQVAQSKGISIVEKNGKKIPFKAALDKVDRECHIIPQEFSSMGYTLFGELSDVVHGKSDEETSLKKYDALRRLVVGILDNVKNNETLIKNSKEILQKIHELGWSDDADLNEENNDE